MSEWLHWASGACLLLGSLLCLSGAVGMLRFPDFFSRIHAAGVTDTLGTPLMILGLVLQLGWTQDSFKLGLVVLFVLATNPTASHAMAKAALEGGLRPRIGGGKIAQRPEHEPPTLRPSSSEGRDA